MSANRAIIWTGALGTAAGVGYLIRRHLRNAGNAQDVADDIETPEASSPVTLPAGNGADLAPADDGVARGHRALEREAPRGPPEHRRDDERDAAPRHPRDGTPRPPGPNRRRPAGVRDADRRVCGGPRAEAHRGRVRHRRDPVRDDDPEPPRSALRQRIGGHRRDRHVGRPADDEGDDPERGKAPAGGRGRGLCRQDHEQGSGACLRRFSRRGVKNRSRATGLCVDRCWWS